MIRFVSMWSLHSRVEKMDCRGRDWWQADQLGDYCNSLGKR